MFIIRGFIKMAEQDYYNEGCDPDSNTHFAIDVQFTSLSARELIDQVKEYFAVNDDALQLGACDEIGRIDIQRTENVNGEEPSVDQIERWKKDKYDLWAVTYTGTVEIIAPAYMGWYLDVPN